MSDGERMGICFGTSLFLFVVFGIPLLLVIKDKTWEDSFLQAIWRERRRKLLMKYGTPADALPVAPRAVEPLILTPSAGGYVYLVKGERGFYKIGKSKDPNNRVQTFGIVLPVEVQYEHVINCTDRHTAERTLHRVFDHRRYPGEWFALTPDDVTVIKAIKEM